jgi:protein TonB
MNKFCLLLSLLICSLAAVAQAKVPLADVGKHVGETVTVTGTIVNGRYLDNSKSKLTLLHMGAAFPNQLLTVVIQDENRSKFSYKPEEELKHKTVAVTGEVTDLNGKPQITISAPSEIQIVEAEPLVVQAPRPITKEEEELLFTKVDEEAKFPGGLEGWRNFLERNLRAEAPIKDNAKKGIYPVTVQFIVDQKGLVSNVKAIQGPEECPTCIEEAVRVIRKGPRWIPAKQNGKPVRYQAIQKISFLMN